MLLTDIPALIAQELHVQPVQVEKTVALLDEGNTVPFIARYRKEVTGSLLDEQIRTVEERLGQLRNLVKRQEEILKSIADQGKLTPALQQQIENAKKITELEDLYLPYKQKRRTRAQAAREKGLEPLAAVMLAQEKQLGTAEEAAQAFVKPEQGVETAAEALSGARDILAEMVAEQAALRQELRKNLWYYGALSTELIPEAEGAETYQMYANYREPIRTLPSHRILAINRGEKTGCLKVRVVWDETMAMDFLERRFVKGPSVFTR